MIRLGNDVEIWPNGYRLESFVNKICLSVNGLESRILPSRIKRKKTHAYQYVPNHNLKSQGSVAIRIFIHEKRRAYGGG